MVEGVLPNQIVTAVDIKWHVTEVIELTYKDSAGSGVMVTLEIAAKCPEGVPEAVVRTVSENCRTLKFDSQGFEEE